ncbi:hypothetical protein D3H65_17685 [Paraflavitalea soli]|uniref:DUF4625 domain-containing protein n=2 Tax=Paraflavitalea soli TaxID=2315862 RepID=A0A3B7MNI1_9BACT|nr:hypothetical protein D3H65_17685 [Paraflavitalea soli]
MKNMRYITICAGILLVLACGKDKPATKPSIKIKSVSGNIVPPSGGLQITLEFSDKEGDVNDSLFVKKIRLNTIPPVSGTTIRDSFWLMIPDFPAKSNGEIILNLDYQNHLISAAQAPNDPNDPTKKISDTIIMRFALQDKGGNTSDTVNTDKIVIMR